MVNATESDEKAQQKRRYRFVKQYVSLNRAELFFADKAVLLEGDTERMLGVGVDEADSAISQPPGTYLHKVQGGLYAIFTTPLVGECQYVQSIHDTWRQILEQWLPESKYEYDSERVGYEYYDERDHGEMTQMDIFVPIRERK